MGKGMGSGDFTEAASQILGSATGPTEIWISDTVNTRTDGKAVGYHAVSREGKSPKLSKYRS